MASRHRLLERQLRGIDPEGLGEDLQRLLQKVSDAYTAADEDRITLERSLELSSQELFQANSEMRAVFRACPDLFLWTNDDGRVTNVNHSKDPRYRPTHDIVGSHIEDIVVEGKVEPLRTALELARDQAEMAATEYSLGQGDDRRHYEARLIPLAEDRYIGIVRDITARRQIQDFLSVQNEIMEHRVQKRTEQLERAKAEAEAANRAKSEFLANMSHELRTPLHGILSFASFGLKRACDPDRDKHSDYFRHIEGSGRTLLELVNNLLDLAKLESGKAAPSLSMESLPTLIGDVVDEFRSLLAERSITVSAPQVEEEIHACVDGGQFKQVLRNLLSNAVKFSSEGQTIEVELGECGDDVQIAVVDSGVGIPQDELGTIFGKFQQSSVTASGAGGTGLGLAICRQITDLHGGRIWAENREPRGARFVLQLPREPLVTTPPQPVGV